MSPKVSGRAEETEAFERAWRKRWESFGNDRDDDAGIAGYSQTGLSTRVRCYTRAWSPQKPDSLWLDAGCGAGTFSRFLGGRQISTIGVDCSLPTIIKARRKNCSEIHWLVADVTHLPLKQRTFDGVLCLGVIQQQTNLAPLVRELVRATKPGGEIWLDGVNGWCLPTLCNRMYRKLRKRPIYFRYHSVRHIKHMMREHRLVEISFCWVPILPTPLGWLQPLFETELARWVFGWIPLAGTLFSHAFLIRARVRATTQAT